LGVFRWVIGLELFSGDEVVQGHMEQPGHFHKDLQIRNSAALFVHSHGTGADVELLGQLRLGQMVDFFSNSSFVMETFGSPPPSAYHVPTTKFFEGRKRQK